LGACSFPSRGKAWDGGKRPTAMRRWREVQAVVPPPTIRPSPGRGGRNTKALCRRRQLRYNARTKSDCVIIPVSRFSSSMIGMWWWPPSENSGTRSTTGRSALATRTWRVMICPTTSGLSDITVRVARIRSRSLPAMPSWCCRSSWRKKSACVTMPTTRRVRSVTGSALMRRSCISAQASCSGVPNSTVTRSRDMMSAQRSGQLALVRLEPVFCQQRFEVVAADVQHLVVARQHGVESAWLKRASAAGGRATCTCG
jgi:hypothetical protein